MLANTEYRVYILFTVVIAILVSFTMINAVAQEYPPGMVSYWRLDEGSGTLASDSVGINHGTVYGATWTPGQVAEALSFDGINNDYVEVMNSESLNIINEITIEAWVFIKDFPTSNPWYNMQVLQKDGLIYEHAYSMPILGEYGIFHGSGIKPRRFGLELTIDGQWSGTLIPGGAWSNTPLNECVWYHLVATYDGASIKLYLNSVLDASYPISGQIEINNFPVHIGNWNKYDWDRFNGVLDEVAIYNRALTPEEIYQHYKNGLDGLGYEELNQPPIAKCKDITVIADDFCQSEALINDGSHDTDDDPITVIQDPSGPYPLGVTNVTLTVIDDKGASASCTAAVTVVDTTPPKVQCNSPQTITPPDVPISFTVTAMDNCEVSKIEITEYDCFFYNPAGKRVDKTGSCVVEISGDTITILDSGGVGDIITWTVTAIDSSGNTTEETFSLEVVNPGKGNENRERHETCNIEPPDQAVNERSRERNEKR